MNTDRSDQTTAYIDNTLSVADRNAFEQALDTDTALAQRVAAHYLLAQAAKEAANNHKKMVWA